MKTVSIFIDREDITSSVSNLTFSSFIFRQETPTQPESTTQNPLTQTENPTPTPATSGVTQVSTTTHQIENITQWVDSVVDFSSQWTNTE